MKPTEAKVPEEAEFARKTGTHASVVTTVAKPATLPELVGCLAEVRKVKVPDLIVMQEAMVMRNLSPVLEAIDYATRHVLEHRENARYLMDRW